MLQSKIQEMKLRFRYAGRHDGRHVEQMLHNSMDEEQNPIVVTSRASLFVTSVSHGHHKQEICKCLECILVSPVGFAARNNAIAVHIGICMASMSIWRDPLLLLDRVASWVGIVRGESLPSSRAKLGIIGIRSIRLWF